MLYLTCMWFSLDWENLGFPKFSESRFYFICTKDFLNYRSKLILARWALSNSHWRWLEIQHFETKFHIGTQAEILRFLEAQLYLKYCGYLFEINLVDIKTGIHALHDFQFDQMFQYFSTREPLKFPELRLLSYYSFSHKCTEFRAKLARRVQFIPMNLLILRHSRAKRILRFYSKNNHQKEASYNTQVDIIIRLRRTHGFSRTSYKIEIFQSSWRSLK